MRVRLDTKYRANCEKPSEADLYQMVTYCKTLGINRALLLYPGDTAATDTFRIKGEGEVVVETQAMSLSGTLAEFRARWMQWADDIVMTLNTAGT